LGSSEAVGLSADWVRCPTPHLKKNCWPPLKGLGVLSEQRQQ
jgi:hypothetical protein